MTSNTTQFNYGALLHAMGDAIPPDSDALIHINPDGSHAVRSWGDLTRRSNMLANALIDSGIGTHEKVAFYLRNCSEYMELVVACFKAGLIHVNVNYRYIETELEYIFDNSDASVVVFASEFSEQVENLRPRLDKVQLWLEVGAEASADCYEQFLAKGNTQQPSEERLSADDMLFLYTGGTTGLPKGVMWDHSSLWRALTSSLDLGENTSIEAFVQKQLESHPNQRQVPVCPLMHGTGLFSAISTIAQGGCVITLGHMHFEPEALLDAVDNHGVEVLAIVGDAFAKPMLSALQAQPNRWQLSTLGYILSSGVMWSHEVKQGLLEFMPQLLMVDSFGSSEGIGFGSSVAMKGEVPKVAKFNLGPNVKVIAEDGTELKPGDPELGFVALCNTIPLGYYKDLEKTEKTFPKINGVRYSIPGDWCRVEADGTLTLLGRGSQCINSAGEKIFPEEVEEALKQHENVEDALVVGVADPKWGQQVVAVIKLEKGQLDESELQNHCRDLLARYKVPKRILETSDMHRASNGKADYKYIQQFAEERVQ